VGAALRTVLPGSNFSWHSLQALCVACGYCAGICPYDKVVCLVVDECHRATGKTQCCSKGAGQLPPVACIYAQREQGKCTGCPALTALHSSVLMG